MNAARNAVYQLPANTGHSCGNTSQTISNCSNVGVARKNQLYRKTRKRTTRKRDERPRASGNPSRMAAPSDAHVSPMARSAPLQYGAEVSASQNRWVSKLASTLRASLLHVARGDLLLRCQPLQRAVLLQRLDRALERLAELRVGLAVIDPEGVLLREQVGDRELAGMLSLLIRTLRVLCEDGVGPSDQQLGDRVGVARIAGEVHLRFPGRLELVVQALQVHLVLGTGLHGDVLTGQIVGRL